MADTQLIPIAQSMLDCLRTQALANPNPPANFCLRAGEEATEDIDPLVDQCCEGLGWVRLGDTFPSSNNLEPDAVTIKCLPVGWAQVLEVGIMRCYPGSTQVSMPSCADHTNASINDANDIQAIKSAICCWGETLRKGTVWTVQSIIVNGPRGGCISRVATLLIQVGKCC